jgi:hypothetical protein
MNQFTFCRRFANVFVAFIMIIQIISSLDVLFEFKNMCVKCSEDGYIVFHLHFMIMGLNWHVIQKIFQQCWKHLISWDFEFLRIFEGSDHMQIYSNSCDGNNSTLLSCRYMYT